MHDFDLKGRLLTGWLFKILHHTAGRIYEFLEKKGVELEPQRKEIHKNINQYLSAISDENKKLSKKLMKKITKLTKKLE